MVKRDKDLALLNINAHFRIDSSCILSVRGRVQEISDPRLIDQATAFELLGNAIDADAADDPERVAHLAMSAFEQLAGVTISEFPQKLDIAAFAAEKLLEAGHPAQADEVLAVNPLQLSQLPRDHPSRLRFELAQTRALSFSDKNEVALHTRLTLQSRVLSTFGPSSDESLSNQLRIANLKLELGDYSQARAELEALQRSTNRDRIRGDPLRTSAIRALANALGLQGSAKKSLALLGQLRQELVGVYGPNDGRIVHVDDQIVRMQIRLDELELALQGASKVFLWRREHLGFSNVNTLQSCWTLALLYKELGRYDSARALIYTLLDESKRGGSSIPKQLTLKTLATLGSIEGADGNFEAATDIWRSVWQKYVAILGENSFDTAGALMNYALLLIQNGRVDIICPTLREKAAENRIGPSPDVQLKALSKILLGLCLLTEAPSRQAVEEGLAGIEGAWIDLKRRDGANSYSAMYALSTLAWADYQYGKRETAKLHLRALVALGEQLRRSTPARSYTHDFWFSKWIVDRSQNLGYRTLALLHAEDGEVEEALRISELARDRRLRDRFVEQKWLAGMLPGHALEKLQNLTSAVQALDEKLALEDRVVERVNLESQRTLAVGECDGLTRKAVRRYGVNASYSDLPSVRQLRALLPAGTAAASIQRSGDRWWALVIDRESPARIVILNRDPDLSSVARAWTGLLGSVPSRAWPMPGNHLVLDYERPIGAIGHYLTQHELGERLGRDIFDPLLSAAPKARRFVIVADDELTGVPFAALPIGGSPAIEKIEIAYAPSLATYAMLRRWRGRPVWAQDLLAFAVDAVSQDKSSPVADVGVYAGLAPRVLAYASEHPLPFAAREIEAVSRNFSASRVSIFRGSQASKATLLSASRDGSLQGYRYVHLAAHAFAFPNSPERSMLVLSATESAGAAERVLTAAELSNLKMGSELIVLSACGTAVGRYEQGQGLLGFAFAALAAGNQSAVLSLWEVADDLTERFMASFYERLQRGLQAAQALGETQREFARDPDPRINNPSTWGAFVLYGRS